MIEHRRDERRKLMAFTPVYDLRHEHLLGYLGDLTLQGAMLVGETPVEVDKHLTLGIEFSRTDETPETRMVLPARVAWCRQEGSGTYYNTGIEFLELSAENRKVIEAICERFQFRREAGG